jgi:hypothetical protein
MSSRDGSCGSGALIPFVPHDLAPRPYLGLTGFPVGFDALRPYLAEVEKLFQVDEGPYDEEFVYQIAAAKLVPTGDPDFQARFAKWPSFRNRNVATLLRALIESDRNLEIWINSTATGLEMDRDAGRISSVTGCWKGHRSIQVYNGQRKARCHMCGGHRVDETAASARPAT